MMEMNMMEMQMVRASNRIEQKLKTTKDAWRVVGVATGLALIFTFAMLQTVSWAAPTSQQVHPSFAQQSETHAAHLQMPAEREASPAPTGTARAFFRADLISSAGQRAALHTPASGYLVAALFTDTLYMRIVVNGAISVTSIHLHEGSIGVDGPAIATLYPLGDQVFDASNSITASVPITAIQISKLEAGLYYINLQSDPSSEETLRGQLLPYTIPTHFMAELSGLEEVPVPITTTGTGVGIFTLVTTGTLDFEIAVSGVISISSAHIHRGPFGKSGKILFWLQAQDEPFDPAHPVGGRASLNGEQMVDLLTQHLHANLHTVVNPKGEIRGQVVEARQMYLPLVRQ